MRSKNKTKNFAFFSSFLPPYPPTHNNRNTQEEMNFRNQVWRGRRTPWFLLLYLAWIRRTHLAFQTGTIYTPPSPQWCDPLPTSPPALSAGSLPRHGGEETPMSPGRGSGWPQRGHFCCDHTKQPIHHLLALMSPFLLQLCLVHIYGWCS